MTPDLESSGTRVELVSASPDQEPVLSNLLELYAHDFSEFHHLDIGNDGRFGYPHLPLYWRDPNRHPFLIRVDEKLAGLVLVKRGSQVSGNHMAWDMAEFFVLRAYRRLGIGTQIAHQVWRRFPGRWEVRVMESNRTAHRFWERAIASFAGEPIPPRRVEQNGNCWRVFSFESSGDLPVRS